MNAKNEDRVYLICVLPTNLDESKLKYSEAISWAHSNLNHQNVVQLSLDDIYLLDKNILDIINEENESMIGPFEDSWIFSNKTKETIVYKLKQLNVSNLKEKALKNEIIRLLELAILTSHNMYFMF